MAIEKSVSCRKIALVAERRGAPGGAFESAREAGAVVYCTGSERCGAAQGMDRPETLDETVR